jgi:hypothetical protein
MTPKQSGRPYQQAASHHHSGFGRLPSLLHPLRYLSLNGSRHSTRHLFVEAGEVFQCSSSSISPMRSLPRSKATIPRSEVLFWRGSLSPITAAISWPCAPPRVRSFSLGSRRTYEQDQFHDLPEPARSYPIVGTSLGAIPAGGSQSQGTSSPLSRYGT